MSNLIPLLLDILLVVIAIIAYGARPRVGGQLARGLRILLIGVMILGFAHLIETALFLLFNLDTAVNEIVHRLLVALGFVFIIFGFSTIRRAFE